MARSLIKTVTQKIRNDGWQVTQTYHCPNSEIKQHETELWASVPNGYSGVSAPLPVNVLTEKNALGNDARVVVQYRTPTVLEYMERFPSKAILNGTVASRSITALLDTAGVTVNGLDLQDETGLTRWAREKGSAFKLQPYAQFKVDAIVTSRSTWYDQFTPSIGRINNTPMSMFPADFQQEGRNLLFGMEIRPLRPDKHLYHVRYTFWGSQAGWNGEYVCRKFESRVIEIPVYVEGVDSGVKRQVMRWMPTDATKTPTMFNYGNFSPINGIMQW